MSENLALWLSVERTPPAHVKAISGKAYSGNSPKPHYLVWKATETFGPCGIGWGFSIEDEKLLQGALIEPGFYEQIHMARVKVWYEWDGKRGEVEHVGQTVFSGKRRNGSPFTDEDAPKKSVTDALIKALSMIGFAGDIFMGRYDDSKYVADLKREEASEKAPVPQPPQQQPAPPAPPSTFSKAFNAYKFAIEQATTEPDLRAWSARHKAEIEHNLSEPEREALRLIFTQKLAKLPIEGVAA